MRVPQVLTGSKNTDSPERETTPATIPIADDEEVNRKLMPHRTGFEVCRMIKTNPQTRLERKHRDLRLQRIRVRPRLVW
jgi:hypothetical protein